MTDKAVVPRAIEVRTWTDLTTRECLVIDAMRTRGHDESVELGRDLILEAYLSVTRNCRYNNGNNGFHDYLFHGVMDALTRIGEPFIRTSVSGDRDQAADIIGIMGIVGGYFMRGAPESQYKDVVVQLCEYYFKILKEHDMKSGRRIDADYQPHSRLGRDVKAVG